MPEKATAEALLLNEIATQLETLPKDQHIMLKLTLPEIPNYYSHLIEHERVLRVMALSGGYDRQTATQRLAQNSGMIASFSRALTEGLLAKQSNSEFETALTRAIEEIYQASIAN